ncbi:hypothetical protein D1007_07383 [Hordeum vulgare]|nr:hypothetical protein D1007_07383 [Hordeum vulgare]
MAEASWKLPSPVSRDILPSEAPHHQYKNAPPLLVPFSPSARRLPARSHLATISYFPDSPSSTGASPVATYIARKLPPAPHHVSRHPSPTAAPSRHPTPPCRPYSPFSPPLFLERNATRSTPTSPGRHPPRLQEPLTLLSIATGPPPSPPFSPAPPLAGAAPSRHHPPAIATAL